MQLPGDDEGGRDGRKYILEEANSRWRGRGAELVLLLLKFAPKEERRSNDDEGCYYVLGPSVWSELGLVLDREF